MFRLFLFGGAFAIAVAVLAITTDLMLFRVLSGISGPMLLALYLWLRRTVPRTTGQVEVPGLESTVNVHYDEQSVPHIHAHSQRDLFVTQGYVTAQDRLFQMDMLRRAASGRLAEVLGPAALDWDRHARTLGLERIATASLPLYRKRSQDVLTAYADGVNAYLAKGLIPPECGLLRYTPAPWSPADSLAIAKLIAYVQDESWSGALLRAQLVHVVGGDRAAALMSEQPDPELLSLMTRTDLPDCEPLMHLAAQLKPLLSVQPRSWAVTGAQTPSGKPILANSLHAPALLPGLWYLAHLAGPDQDTAGATLPGIPGVQYGHNPFLAWGANPINGPRQEVLIERTDGTELHQHQEEILVRGHAPVTITVTATNDGPVLARNEESALVLRWAGFRPGHDLEATLAMAEAHSWSEWQQALRHQQAPIQQAICATREGTIAETTVGERLPATASLPFPAWMACTNLPPSDATLNPPTGQVGAIPERFVNATAWMPDRAASAQLEPGHRNARRLLPLLIHAVQESAHSGYHLETLNALEKQALMLLSGWERTEENDQAAPLLWHQWRLFLLEGAFRPAMGLQLFDQYLALGDAEHTADALLLTALQGQPTPWFTADGERSLPRIALRSFKRAVALLAAKHGARLERWSWAKEFTLRWHHPVALRYPWLRSFLEPGITTADGPGCAIHPVHSVQAPTVMAWRQVVDLGQLSAVRTVTAPGQSGHPLSPNATDLLAPWQRGELLPQPYRPQDVQKLPSLVLKPSPRS